MSEMHVEGPVLGAIADGLDKGASGLEELAGSVPSGVDAGPMTAVIASMLAQVTDSAGDVSTSLTGVAALVRQIRRYYERADASAEASLTDIKDVMSR
ncbi:hypothetical protein [Nocardioides sp. YIM 152315]|uniref:hypothetical protein n=1 Tax=Nocardioides sp. YIM 152315 TaxID=3031760 RepID=UPI0023DA8A69|nr:hypothetical protein [Nocardioides sp. YIM 152315]MDF1605136.1 hypothetical protein [Nocardioides sp. YIM 152315]